MHFSTERQEKSNLQKIFQEKLEIFFDKVHCYCDILPRDVCVFCLGIITIWIGLQMDTDGDSRISLTELQCGKKNGSLYLIACTYI